jgi:hypothetical protein
MHFLCWKEGCDYYVMNKKAAKKGRTTGNGVSKRSNDYRCHKRAGRLDKAAVDVKVEEKGN